jgi:hypothetical protein
MREIGHSVALVPLIDLLKHDPEQSVRECRDVLKVEMFKN